MTALRSHTRRRALTWQDRNRIACARNARKVGAMPLTIHLRRGERDYVRARVWYSGASETRIHTSMSSVALAIEVLRTLRRRTPKLTFWRGGYHLR